MGVRFILHPGVVRRQIPTVIICFPASFNAKTRFPSKVDVINEPEVLAIVRVGICVYEGARKIGLLCFPPKEGGANVEAIFEVASIWWIHAALLRTRIAIGNQQFLRKDQRRKCDTYNQFFVHFVPPNIQFIEVDRTTQQIFETGEFNG